MDGYAPGGTGGTADRADRQRRAWRLSGRVQGVGFRWWAARAGRQLGLRGTVENLPDGRVEVHAEGPEAAVRGLERRLRRGPPAARVDALEPIEPAPELPPGFEITGR